MDAKLLDMCQEILDSSPDEKVGLGKKALAEAIKGFKRLGCSDKQISDLIIQTTRLFVSADGSCGAAEYNLFRTITGMDISKDDFYDMTNRGLDPEFVNAYVELMREADKDTRIAVILYGAAVMTSDNTLTVAEQKLIDKLLA